MTPTRATAIELNLTARMTRLVVSNLSPSATAASVDRLFSSLGTVRSVDLATDVMTGRCGGFGFVRMNDLEPGAAAVALRGLRMGDRLLRVAIEQKGDPYCKATEARRRVPLPPAV